MNYFHLTIKSLLVWLVPCSLLIGCAVRENHQQEDSFIRGESNARTVDISGEGEGSLALTTFDSYTILVEGCASGYSVTISSTNPNPFLYKGDHNCIGKLTEFSIAGETFLPITQFQSYEPGNTAQFANGDESIVHQVIVSQQLNSPIQESDQVSYEISNISENDQASLLGMSIGTEKKVKVGAAKTPNYTFFSGEMIGVSQAEQAGIFQFILECRNGIKKPTQPTQANCSGVTLSSIDYVLVADDYNNQPCTNSQPEVCQQLFDGSEKSIDMNSAEYIMPGENGLANGGFSTKIDLSQALVGPHYMATHPNMLLILRSGGGSFQYFNIDLNVTMVF